MSNSVSIEAGCTKIGPNRYIYIYDLNEGLEAISFNSTTTPKIGDTIVDGVLVPLVGYKINNDPGFQLKDK